ncbi:hypothetical protein BT93_G1457 [Corymbia citriodora subsp. variegata]|nr:hypothetical protein BT93_G1457 [Corymbia citriodora subsp. variegata]
MRFLTSREPRLTIGKGQHRQVVARSFSLPQYNIHSPFTNVASSKCFVLIVALILLTMNMSLRARHLLQITMPSIPILPTIPTLPNPIFLSLPTMPTLPKVPPMPAIPTTSAHNSDAAHHPANAAHDRFATTSEHAAVLTAIPKLTLPPMPSIPTSLPKIPSIPFLTPPPATSP